MSLIERVRQVSPSLVEARPNVFPSSLVFLRSGTHIRLELGEGALCRCDSSSQRVPKISFSQRHTDLENVEPLFRLEQPLLTTVRHLCTFPAKSHLDGSKMIFNRSFCFSLCIDRFDLQFGTLFFQRANLIFDDLLQFII